jgi:fructoselysine-6-P-deglycase FrlB-like protein
MAGPLIAIGSGGSLSAAHFAVALHQASCRRIAKAMSPLESNAFAVATADVSFLLLTAGGGNTDILSAFESIVVQEPAYITVLIGSSGSKLAHLVARYRHVECCELIPPSGGDGFLATNSLLAFCVALARAYGAAEKLLPSLPEDFFHLIGGPRQINKWRALCRPLWEREHLIVLFPPMLHAAASDLESKFTEAAIGPVQIADYRQFAHGRHHWLAKRAESTGVLAFVTPSIERLAERTLELLPKSVPIAKLQFPGDNAVSALAALSATIIITGFAGCARGIDPGRPGVPVFGRRIYHLRKTPARVTKAEAVRQRIILRKSNNALADTAPQWIDSLAKFSNRLSQARFRSAIFDYDGTLCDMGERFAGLASEVANNLAALLENDIPVGIATGRGRSVRADLQKMLPKALWSRVVIGYYNGFETALLSDQKLPSRGTASPEMQLLGAELCNHPFISSSATCEVRAGQISLTPLVSVAPTLLWQVVAGIVQERKFSVVMSSHAVDVIPSHVSKVAVLVRIRQLFDLEDEDAVLCIGDRGRPPGNDSLLLARPYSLSVHEVSADPEHCWNLAPPGHRGVQALLDYFRAFRIKKGQFRVAVYSLIREKK